MVIGRVDNCPALCPNTYSSRYIVINHCRLVMVPGVRERWAYPATPMAPAIRRLRGVEWRGLLRHFQQCFSHIAATRKKVCITKVATWYSETCQRWLRETVTSCSNITTIYSKHSNSFISQLSVKTPRIVSTRDNWTLSGHSNVIGSVYSRHVILCDNFRKPCRQSSTFPVIAGYVDTRAGRTTMCWFINYCKICPSL